MNQVKRRALATAAAVFAITLGAGAVVVVRFHRLEAEARRRSAAELAHGSALAIEQRFDSALAAATTVAAMVREGATDAQLDGVARKLLELSGGNLSVQLARDGVISHIWPMKGNEAARRLDLVSDPVHGPFVRRVRQTGLPALYGPFALVQGGSGLALRVPVFVREGGRERFWGLASAIFRTNALLEECRIPRLVEAGYEYVLARAPDGGGGPEVIASSGPKAPEVHSALSVDVELPGQRWQLAVAPRARTGWAVSPLALPAAALLIALLAALIAYRAAMLPALLRFEVETRTHELEVAHQEQRRAEAAQRQSQKLESIGLLAGGVAHDFNNLLVGILGHADVIAQEASPGSDAQLGARTIVQAARRAAELTRQLLALARMGPRPNERVDVGALLKEVGTLLTRTLDKSIRLEVSPWAKRCIVLGDAGQLQQVLLNLAVNARDAMPRGGTLTLESQPQVVGEGDVPGLAPGRYVTISVSDTGVGIPPEHRERIFEPFFTTKPEGQGSGLGLATAFGITRAHGGTVRVYSEVGVGSRFVVHLPALDAADAEPAREEERGPRGSGVVLVVDDEEIVRKTAARVLRSLGYEPVAVDGGQAALDWLERQPAPPFAVLLDVSMPGMDGPTCFRRMRGRVPALRVIVSSGFSRTGGADELLGEGAIAFVQKPYLASELARALAAAPGPSAPRVL